MGRSSQACYDDHMRKVAAKGHRLSSLMSASCAWPCARRSGAPARGKSRWERVLVQEGRVLARAHNRPIHLHDPSAHAEILALRRAGRKLRNYRLEGCDLYVTIEPCAMCAGAIVHARLRRTGVRSARPQGGRMWISPSGAEPPQAESPGRTERYRSGHNGGASKASCLPKAGTWVRIPPSPPFNWFAKIENATKPGAIRPCLSLQSKPEFGQG
jgi:tRNA(Arg) A34 adenosine deaminase TadA